MPAEEPVSGSGATEPVQQAAILPEFESAESGDVVPCYLDPECSRAQAEIQNEWTARNSAQPSTIPAYTEPAWTSTHDMCTNAFRAGVRPLPAVCYCLGG